MVFHTSGTGGATMDDIIRQQDDSERFVLVEVYRTSEDPGRHKETAHYKKWRDTVAKWMAQPRKGEKHIIVAPQDKSLW